MTASLDTAAACGGRPESLPQRTKPRHAIGYGVKIPIIALSPCSPDMAQPRPSPCISPDDLFSCPLTWDLMPHSASRLRTARFLSFALAAALLVAVGIAMVLSLRGVTHSNEAIEHTYQVMAAAEAVRSSARSVESSARGYRLSGRSSALAEYMTAVPQAHAAAVQLMALTTDHPAKQQRARKLQVLVRQRLAELQRLNDLQVEQGIERARQESTASRGFEQMQHINALTEQILVQERILLAARRGDSARRTNLMTVIVVVGIVLPLVLLAVLLWGLVRENRRSQALERKAQTALLELADALEQRSRLSEQRRMLGAYAGLLQSCQSLDEVMNVTAQVVAEALPHAGGRCYALRASQNLAETAATFGQETVPSDSLLQPDSCWGLRRGQPHRSGAGIGSVRCAHLDVEGIPDDVWTLCVPLIAQGMPLGMLHLNGVGAGSDEYVPLA
ncbi:MAG: CHASE3 domain-containing protein, partial [Lysobacter sp.]